MSIKEHTPRRNLSHSFNNSGSFDHNYSVVQISPNKNKPTNPLVLKFRRSIHSSNNYLNQSELLCDISDTIILDDPQVLLKKSDNIESLLPQEKIAAHTPLQKKDNNLSNLRRSCRKTNRVSYVDYNSPKKTPTKRNRKVSTDSNSSVKISIENLTPKKARAVNVKEFSSDDEASYKAKKKPSRPSRTSVKPERYRDLNEESPNKRKFSMAKKAIHSSSDDESSYKDETPLGRHGRLSVKHSPKKVCNEQNHSTPRKSVRYRKEYMHKRCESASYNKNYNDQIKTPDKNNTTGLQTAKSAITGTPSMRAKLIKEGVVTPSVQMRATPIKNDCTPLNKAREKLHVSYLPEILPCREKEYNDIFNFLEGKLLDGCGGCMYVSGVPGTGKTATVTDVIRKLETKSQRGSLPTFSFLSVNGMKLTEPRQAYVEILKQLTGKTVSWEQAQSTLDIRFTAKSGKQSGPIILLIDELDILCTKRQDVVYNLLDWPTKASVQLIVVTIANTMDLPERLLMGRVTSRLGLTRLTFQAYTHKQLQEIVVMRLMGTKVFKPDAVQLVARKVASVSGDARRALDICRRAAEIAEIEGADTLVSMSHVNEALNAMITQPKVKAIKFCPRLQRLILQAVVAEVERTGVEETTFSDVYTMFESIAAINGFQKVSCTLALAAVSKLGACRLLLVDQKPNDFHQKLILNVSSDDVYYALRKD